MRTNSTGFRHTVTPAVETLPDDGSPTRVQEAVHSAGQLLRDAALELRRAAIDPELPPSDAGVSRHECG